MNNWLSKCIGRVIMTRRHNLNLTLSQLAQQSGISPRELMAIERGGTDPDLVMLNEICCVLGTTVAVLFAEAYNIDPERIVLVCSRDKGEFDTRCLVRKYREVICLLPNEFKAYVETHRIDLLIMLNRDLRLDMPQVWTQYQMKRAATIVVGDCMPDRMLPTERALLLEDVSKLERAVDSLLAELPKGRITKLRRQQEELRNRREELEMQRAQMVKRQQEVKDKMDSLLVRQIQLCEMLSNRSVYASPNLMDLLATLHKYREQLKSLSRQIASETVEIHVQSQFARHRARFFDRQEKLLKDANVDVM